MALVDYSDSDSDSETVTKPTTPAPASAAVPPQTATTAKQPVQKVVDRSNPRKIVVSLSGTSKSDESKTTASTGDEPPVKRARTGGGAFSGFASFLPPPKNAGKAATVASSAAKTVPRRPGVNLKTGAGPGFSRGTDLNDDTDDNGDESSSQQQAQPTIPAGQKPADEVKLVGKPVMFKPLSVSRRPVKKKSSTTAKPATTTTAGLTSATPSQTDSQSTPESAEPPKKKKKVSLFSIAQDEPADAAPSTGAYEPMFTTPQEQAETDSAAAFAAYDAQNGGASAYPSDAAAATTSSPASLSNLAASMNLSKAARRELFGRAGAPDAASAASSSSRIIDFNTDKEYAHNEELRASGEQQTFNPVRAIAPGKHNLRQLVTQVHNQRDALEESFAKGKNNQREAGSRYGWR